jgi:hypothetical protein
MKGPATLVVTERGVTVQLFEIVTGKGPPFQKAELLQRGESKK